MRSPEYVDKEVPDAYHGTELGVAKRIEKGERFKKSKRDDLYLGDGVYFFEGSSELAQDWAKWRFKHYGIICATIQLGFCLDFHTVRAVQIIRFVEEKLKKKMPGKTIQIPAVINFYVENINPKIDTIRATNVKVNRPIIEEDKFYLSELIICVRNLNNIKKVSLVEQGVGNAR